MLNLLIVDDEAIAIRGVEAGINWENIGVSSVFKAYSARQAKEVFQRQHIDILLSDIEMPQENGIQLLEWVKQNYPKTETIILSCHTDFSYARKALQLGSSDYALKSMTYEVLENIIKKAVEKVEYNKKLIKYSELGELWEENHPHLVEQFWVDIINRRIVPNDDDFGRLGMINDNRIFPGMYIMPILLQPARKTDAFNKNELISGVRCLIKESLIDDGADGYFVNFGSSGLLFILRVDDKIAADFMHLKEELIKTANMYGQKYQVGLSCYIGVKTTPSQLADVVEELHEMQKDNVMLKEGLFYLVNKSTDSSQITDNYLASRSSSIMEGYYDCFVTELEGYFEHLADIGKMNSSVLKQFHQDFLQLIYSLLKQKNIQAHLLFNDALSISLFDKATNSTFDMMEWVKYIVGSIKNHTEKLENSLSVIDKAKRYIALHLAQDLSREDIANYVYLNPDYLTRIFKKETGQTLSDYIQCQRILSAKELLKNTDLCVSTIAERLGYSNFSHFARMFRKNTGMTPMEYKKSRHE